MSNGEQQEPTLEEKLEALITSPLAQKQGDRSVTHRSASDIIALDDHVGNNKVKNPFDHLGFGKIRPGGTG